MDAVRRYSQQFDNWAPPSFEMTLAEIENAIANVPRPALEYRLLPGERPALCPGAVEDAPAAGDRDPAGVILGHKHIPVNSVGSYIPGGRYPMFGSAQMSIIPAKVAGVKQVVAGTPPVSSAS